MNEDIVVAARAWLGVKWQHQGRSREGIDCAGLVIEIAKSLRASTFDTTDYPRIADDESMVALCDRFLARVDASEAAPGDVGVFKFGPQRHMAIFGDYYAGGLSLIHAYALYPRKVVEVRFDEKWASRLVGVWRIPQVVA